MMKERRIYPRLKSHLVVGFRMVESFDDYKTEMTENIGMGGFMVEMEDPDPSFVIGRAMEVTIRDPREKSEPVRGLGRVIWMREKEDRTGCEIGIMLTYIRAEDKSRYARHFMEKKPA